MHTTLLPCALQALTVLTAFKSVVAVWPKPSSIHQDEQLVKLSSNFTIRFSGRAYPLPSGNDDLGYGSFVDVNDDDFIAAIKDALHQIRYDHHQVLNLDRGLAIYEQLVHYPAQSRSDNGTVVLGELASLEIIASPNVSDSAVKPSKDACSNFQGQVAAVPEASAPQTSVEPWTLAAEMKKSFQVRDESYKLTIVQAKPSSPPPSHSPVRAVLSASNALGALRGLQTFTQLVYTARPVKGGANTVQNHGSSQVSIEAASGKDILFMRAPLCIQDAPAFPYRGLLLDTSRNYYPVASLERTIQAMSWAKLNVLQWHLVDAQSWPLEIPSHPELAGRGAYSPSEVYTPDDVQRLARLASSKGVELMLEIDTPGHTAIIGEAYPDFIACKNKQPWTTYAAEPPAGQLRMTDERAVNLVKEVFAYATKLVPGTLFSSGGDEVNQKCYEEDPITQQALRSSNRTLNQVLKNFVTQTHEVIRSSGKVPVVWEEMVLGEDLGLPLDTIVAVWKSSKNAQQVAQKGYPIVHVASDYSYLDCGSGEWLGNDTEGVSWCDPFKTWQKIYSFNPYGNITDSQRKLILGGQTALWSEQADGQNVDGILWPRALSAAEVYWSGQDEPRLATEALPRIQDMRYRMVERGIRATPLQPHWCALRPGMCDLPPQ